MSPAPAYYTDDITLMPTREIWRSSRLSGLFAPLIFCFFYLRKCLRLPFQARHGAPWPESLPIVEIGQLPQEAREAFAQRFAALDACGYALSFCTKTPFIGCKSGASAVFLSREGESFATLVWIEIKLERFERADTFFACHSLLESGGELTTANLRPDQWIPEMIPPEITIFMLPEGTPPHDIARAHRERIARPPHRPKLLDTESLQAHSLAASQRLYNHLIEKKLYRRLSDAEVERLRK